MSFDEAFIYATEEQEKLLSNLDLQIAVTAGNTQHIVQEFQQVPQKYDQNQIYSLDKLLLVKNMSSSTFIDTNIRLNQVNYKIGHTIIATITEELNQGYDLYLAVVLPSGDFLTLRDKNTFAPINSPEPWEGKRSQGIATDFLDLSLPLLPEGQYCLLSVLSPENKPVMSSIKFWKQTQRCFSIE